MMLAATLPFLALCVISIHARALVANDGIAVRDTSPTSPAEELISLAPSSPVIDDLDLEASSSTTSSNTTVVSDDAIPATVQGNSSSVLNPQSPVALDPHSYHVPGTPITLMLAKLGAALPAGPADDALEAVLDQLNLEIRTSGDQMMPRVYHFTQNGIDIQGHHPFRNQATLRDLEMGLLGVQDLMELKPAEGGIGFTTADFAFSKEGRGVIGRILVGKVASDSVAVASVETS